MKFSDSEIRTPSQISISQVLTIVAIATNRGFKYG